MGTRGNETRQPRHARLPGPERCSAAPLSGVASGPLPSACGSGRTRGSSSPGDHVYAVGAGTASQVEPLSGEMETSDPRLGWPLSVHIGPATRTPPVRYGVLGCARAVASFSSVVAPASSRYMPPASVAAIMTRSPLGSTVPTVCSGRPVRPGTGAQVSPPSVERSNRGSEPSRAPAYTVFPFAVATHSAAVTEPPRGCVCHVWPWSRVTWTQGLVFAHVTQKLPSDAAKTGSSLDQPFEGV